MQPNSKLPEPTPEAKQHSHELTQRIKTHIKRHGKLSFAEFMQRALYTPDYGYYTNALPKIGKTGDFITAPEISPIFSRCIAQQCQQILTQLKHPNIIEFGAGRGTMAKDILLALAEQNIDLDQYYIIELSATLKAQQQTTLADLPKTLLEKVIWLDTLPNKPLEAIVLANEVLDAMPVERLKIEAAQSSIAQVIFDEAKQHFDWQYHPITDPTLIKFTNRLIQAIGIPTQGSYQTEINLNIQPWLNAISQFLSKGMVLLIDYGYNRQEYYQPARSMGTLRCHYQHLAHSNPFYYPGLQDITAHVDFTEVAESGFSAGFKVAGFTTQANFLMATGLLDMAASPEADITQQIKTAQQIKTLTLPDEMGETFKVMALTKDLEGSLIGFKLRDLRHQL